MRARLRLWALGCGCLATLLGGAAWYVDRVGVRGRETYAVGMRGARAVVVLGARVEPDGQASPTLRARVAHGVDVFRASGADVLVVSGGVGDFGASEAEVGCQLAEALGVPAALCLREAASHSTAENARLTVRLLHERYGHREPGVTLVSDPYHLLRAAMLFEREGVDVDTSPVLDAPRHRDWRLRVAWTLREVAATMKEVVTAAGHAPPN